MLTETEAGLGIWDVSHEMTWELARITSGLGPPFPAHTATKLLCIWWWALHSLLQMDTDWPDPCMALTVGLSKSMHCEKEWKEVRRCCGSRRSVGLDWYQRRAFRSGSWKQEEEGRKWAVTGQNRVAIDIGGIIVLYIVLYLASLVLYWYCIDIVLYSASRVSGIVGSIIRWKWLFPFPG